MRDERHLYEYTFYFIITIFLFLWRKQLYNCCVSCCGWNSFNTRKALGKLFV